MNTDRDRLEDQNIEEALGRVTPPDLTKRIVQAANAGLDDAVTPISGVHSVPRNLRPPAGRRMTAAVPRRNWQGAGIVATFAVLFTAGLAAFVLLKDPAPHVVEPDTAETRQTHEPTTTEQNTNQSPPRKRWSPDNNDEQPADPQPKEQSEPKEEPQPKRQDDVVDQPGPAPESDQPAEHPKPEPKDTVEQPSPEPDQPKDTPAEPKPEPEQPQDTVEEPEGDGKTVAKPESEPVAVAYIPAGAYIKDYRQYLVRKSAGAPWEPILPGGDDADSRAWIYDGWQLQASAGDIYLTNGAFLQLDGKLEFRTHAQGLRVEIVEDELYLDNVSCSSTVFVTHNELEIEVGEGAAVFELSVGKLGIFCVDGQVEAEGKVIPAGHKASLGKRGISAIREATRRDWSHPLLTGAPPRQLGIEDFEISPLGGMISGRLETRTSEQIGLEEDGHVAVDSGRRATVAFQFDGEHETLRGEKVRVRYRATGAAKLILQMFCPARNDNFGKDIAPGKPGEWHVLEIPLKDLRDRETHRDAPPPGTKLSSFSLILTGQDDAQLEVDWVELVREPKFEK